MTGLNYENDEIMEVGCLVTTPDFEEVDEPFESVIHISEEKLKSMDEWCTQNHAKVGHSYRLLRHAEKSMPSMKTKLL